MKKIYFAPMLFITLVMISLFTTFAHAATLEVGTGKPYTTIQSAVNAANTSDTVLVYDGTYVEHIKFNGKAITVTSLNGAATTIIDGSTSGSVVTFSNGEGSGSVLDGFTIRNGNSYNGGGIYCSSSSSPSITNCTISGNTANNSGGGINCSSSSSPSITNCTISGNTAAYGGGISCLHSSPVITNCTIIGNTANNYGGGIYCSSSSSPAITNCTISGNTASSFGGGINCSSSSPSITNCTISGNTVLNWYGGGIYCSSSSSPAITNCTIIGNTTTTDGGGIYCSSSSPAITNCTISGNAANYSGGGMAFAFSSPTVNNSILWGDTAPNSKEIYFGADSTITFTYSDVEGGWTGGGEGNINADPLFVGNGNYHLKAGSPCIDKGTSVGAPTYDIDGDSRPQGNGYDMGSDEYIGASIPCSVWADVIAKYNVYVGGQAAWNDVIACYNQYASK